MPTCTLLTLSHTFWVSFLEQLALAATVLPNWGDRMDGDGGRYFFCGPSSLKNSIFCGPRSLSLSLYLSALFAKRSTGLCKVIKFFSQNQPQHSYFFISHQLLFITFQIKNNYKTKNFTFLYKTFLLFSSYQSNLLQYQSTSSSPVLSQTHPSFPMQ
jgi:hypothetical protein